MSPADLAQTDTLIPDDLHGLWDIGGWREVEELSGGAVNRVFSVKTSSGRYVLRRYRAGTASQLNREARVTMWVRRDGGQPGAFVRHHWEWGEAAVPTAEARPRADRTG